MNLRLAPLAALLLLSAAPASARRDDPPPAAPAPAAPAAIDPAARAVLDRMAVAYRDLKALSLSLEFSGKAPGRPDAASRASLLFQRPGNLRLTVTDTVHNEVTRRVLTGRTLYEDSSVDRTRYMRRPVRSDLEGIQQSFRSAGTGLLMILLTQPDAVSILQSPPPKQMTKEADAAVEGVAVEVVTLSFETPDGKGSYRLEIGKDDHLLRRLRITGALNNNPVDLTETCREVQVNPVVAADAFVYTPEPGAKVTTPETGGTSMRRVAPLRFTAKARTTRSGLRYEDVVVGKGAVARAGMEVTVHYTGMLVDGRIFDSSQERRKPFRFSLGVGRVIPGWDEGVAGMRVGGRRYLKIPPSLGYGKQAVGAIPPGSTLLFEVDLLDARKP